MVALWRGVIIEESLEEKSLLNHVKIFETKKETLENEEEAGVLTFHKIEVDDAEKEKFLENARSTIKEKFYMHICKDGVMIVVYRNKVFEFSKNEESKIIEAQEYGIEHGILREQMDFEILIVDPWA